MSLREVGLSKTFMQSRAGGMHPYESRASNQLQMENADAGRSSPVRGRAQDAVHPVHRGKPHNDSPLPTTYEERQEIATQNREAKDEWVRLQTQLAALDEEDARDARAAKAEVTKRSLLRYAVHRQQIQSRTRAREQRRTERARKRAELNTRLDQLKATIHELGRRLFERPEEPEEPQDTLFGVPFGRAKGWQSWTGQNDRQYL